MVNKQGVQKGKLWKGREEEKKVLNILDGWMIR